MDDKQSFLDALMRQVGVANLASSPPLQDAATSNCGMANSNLQDHSVDIAAYGTATLREMSERFQGVSLKIDELSTIRKLLEQCTIDATRREVIHVLESACSHPEECIDCPYKNSLGECSRNERIADILLNRFGRVK